MIGENKYCWIWPSERFLWCISTAHGEGRDFRVRAQMPVHISSAQGAEYAHSAKLISLSNNCLSCWSSGYFIYWPVSIHSPGFWLCKKPLLFLCPLLLSTCFPLRNDPFSWGITSQLALSSDLESLLRTRTDTSCLSSVLPDISLDTFHRHYMCSSLWLTAGRSVHIIILCVEG
jgi:hypothetical protein